MTNRYRRIDGRPTYWRDEGLNSVRCASKTDESPVQLDYNPACAACWLGHPHTHAYHYSQLVVDGVSRL